MPPDVVGPELELVTVVLHQASARFSFSSVHKASIIPDAFQTPTHPPPQVLQQVLDLRGGAAHLVAVRLRAARLAALSAVQTYDEDDDSGDHISDTAAAQGPVPGAAGAGPDGAEHAVGEQQQQQQQQLSSAFQKGYAAVAAALPEELQPLLSGVLSQQEGWREAERERRRRQQERERRRLERRRAPEAVGAGKEGPAAQGSGTDEEEEEQEGVYDSTAGARDAVLEDELARKLSLDMWPCRCGGVWGGGVMGAGL